VSPRRTTSGSLWGRGLVAPVISVIPLPGGCACVRLIGEFDLAAAHALRHHLRCAIALTPYVAVETRGVTFLDCSCLGVLIWALGYALQRGGRLCLVGLPPPVLRLLSLTETNRRFRSCPDLSSAMDIMGCHIPACEVAAWTRTWPMRLVETPVPARPRLKSADEEDRRW
jgi:anti-sigma B factor antagonist